MTFQPKFGATFDRIGRPDGRSTSSHVALADVADPQVAGRRGRTRSATGCAGRRRRISGLALGLARRTGCRAGSCTAGPDPSAAPGTDPQELAEERRRGSGRCPNGSPPEPPSPIPMYRSPSGPNASAAAVVVRERLVDLEEDPLAGRIGLVGRRGRDGERRDHGVPARGRCSRRRAADRRGSPARTPARAARARRRSSIRALDVEERRGPTRAPSRTIRIRPGCSTTKSRPLPSPALTIAERAVQPVTTGSSRIVRPAGSKLPLGGGGDGALGGALGPTVGSGARRTTAGPGLDGVADGPCVGVGLTLEPQAMTTSATGRCQARRDGPAARRRPRATDGSCRDRVVERLSLGAGRQDRRT